MFISSVLFRSTLRVKDTITGSSVFKNLLEKCVLQRFTNFRILNENSRSFWTSSQRRVSDTRFNKSVNNLEKSFDEAKAVLNNVLIFKFERSTAYKVIITFAVVQLFGMLSMASNVYDTFCKDMFETTKSWKERFSKHPYSIVAICTACIFGPAIFVIIFFFASRTIRRIILHKGGEKVTIVTYNVIPSRRVFTESLDNVCCKASRTSRATLPLCVKGQRFYYFIDTDGDILNENLFDFTIGLKREFD